MQICLNHRARVYLQQLLWGRHRQFKLRSVTDTRWRVGCRCRNQIQVRGLIADEYRQLAGSAAADPPDVGPYGRAYLLSSDAEHDASYHTLQGVGQAEDELEGKVCFLDGQESKDPSQAHQRGDTDGILETFGDLLRARYFLDPKEAAHDQDEGDDVVEEDDANWKEVTKVQCQTRGDETTDDGK